MIRSIGLMSDIFLYLVKGFHVVWMVGVVDAPAFALTTRRYILYSIPPALTMASYLLFDHRCILIDLESYVTNTSIKSTVTPLTFWTTVGSVTCCLTGTVLSHDHQTRLTWSYLACVSAGCMLDSWIKLMYSFGLTCQ